MWLIKGITLALLVLVYFRSTAGAARILGIFTITGKSHFLCNHAIMKSLHAAGHNITMITPFPSHDKIENFTYIDLNSSTFVYVGQTAVNDFRDLTVNAMMKIVNTMEIQLCEDVMRLKEIQEVLNSPVKLYDVIFAEILAAYECFTPIAEKLGIPFIGTVTFSGWKLADYAVGLPNSPMIVRAFGSTHMIPASGMNFIERIENLWNDLILMYTYQTMTRTLVDKFHREFFTEELPRKTDISLVFYNNDPSLLPRSVPPNVKEIGGIHLQPPKPLPQNLQKFIDKAKYGVVLITFGSVVNASTLQPEKREAFLAAFAAIPQRVIWKFEEPIDDLPKNIMLSDWLPQRDILEHKNVIAFISHCGQSGTYEAMMTGTPVIAIPLFGDQIQNADHLLRRGVAVYLDYDTLTKETVSMALNTIINDTSYYRKMQALSRVFKDRPMSPQDSIVYWTEYVIRHNGAPHLKSLGTDMPIYKYLMLDIISLALVVTSVVIYATYLTCRKIYKYVMRKVKYEKCKKKND